MLIQYDHETVTHPAWQSFDRFQLEFFLEISYMFPGSSLKRKEDLRKKKQFCQDNDEYVMFKQFSQVWCFPSKLGHLIIAWLDATLV